MKSFTVTCPCCNSQLLVNKQGEVMSSVPKEVPEDRNGELVPRLLWTFQCGLSEAQVLELIRELNDMLSPGSE